MGLRTARQTAHAWSHFSGVDYELLSHSRHCLERYATKVGHEIKRVISVRNAGLICCCRSFVCYLVSANIDCQPGISRTEVSEWRSDSLWEDRSRRSVRWVLYILFYTLIF